MKSIVQLTVVIATYNADKTLTKALDSLLFQRYQDWECLIIDGSSKDHTLDIINEYEQKDCRIRHVSEKDQGIYDAFNKGWQLAQGEWIYYLGSDDVLTTDGLFDQMQNCISISDNVGLLNGGVIRITKDGKQRVMMSKGFIGCHQGMVVRKKALDELGGFDMRYRILSDLDLFVRLRDSHFEVINTRAVLAYFCAGGVSEKFSNTFRVFKEKLEILRKDKLCKDPLFLAIKQTSKTIVGGLIHGPFSSLTSIFAR